MALVFADRIGGQTQTKRGNSCEGEELNFNFNFLSLFCINFQNSCAHHQEEILRILKHPQTSSLMSFSQDKLALLWGEAQLCLP